MWAWGHPLHAQEIPASKSAKAGKGAAPTMGPQWNLIRGPSVLQSPGTWGDGPREPVGRPCSLVIPALMQSRQLAHNTPHPGGCRKHHTPRRQERSWVPKPLGVQTPNPACRRGDRGTPLVSGLGKLRNMLYYFRTRPPSPTGNETCWFAFCLQKTLPVNVVSPALQTDAGRGRPLRTTLAPVIQKPVG